MYNALATIDEKAVAHSRYATYSYETDRYNRARLGFYFSIIQEAAGVHAAIRGLSITDMREEGKTWVITRNITTVHRYARWGEVVSVKTWAAAPIRLHLPRIIEGYDKEGDLLFRTTTLWAILDIETGRPQRPQDYSSRMTLPDPGDADHPTILTLPKPIHKEEDLVLVDRTAVVPTYDDTDRNLHVNNLSYLNWALGALPSRFRDQYNTCLIDASFLRQTFLGDELAVCTWAHGEEVFEAKEPALFHQIIRTEEDGGETVVWEGSSHWKLREAFRP